jgi:hypothetical protein
MFAKKLALLAVSAVTVSAASVANADYWDYRTQTYVREYPSYYVAPAPTYYTYRQYSAPAPTYYYAPAPAYSYYEPAPSYYYAPAPAVGTVTGALAGAIIGNQLADRQHRGAATIAGALVGGAIGSSYDYRYSY